MDDRILNFLDTVVDSISLIEENLAGIGFQDYKTDRKRMITVVNYFETILEALHEIPKEVREAHPEIDWTSFDGIREKIIHPEMGINEEEVWRIAKMKLMKLKKAINSAFFS